jgi:hypothetical protein
MVVWWEQASDGRRDLFARFSLVGRLLTFFALAPVCLMSAAPRMPSDCRAFDSHPQRRGNVQHRVVHWPEYDFWASTSQPSPEARGHWPPCRVKEPTVSCRSPAHNMPLEPLDRISTSTMHSGGVGPTWLERNSEEATEGERGGRSGVSTLYRRLRMSEQEDRRVCVVLLQLVSRW